MTDTTMFENTSNGLSVNAGNTAALTTVTITPNQWFVAAGAINGANTIVALNDTQAVGDAGTDAQAYQVSVPHPTITRAVDLMELVIWSRALTSVELEAEYANLAETYNL